MNPFDDNQPPQAQPEQGQEPQAESPASPAAEPALSYPEHSLAQPTELQGPMPAPVPVEQFPPDLRITWGWVHFLVFFVFSVISLVVVQGVLLLGYMPKQKMTTEQLQEYFLSKPQLVIGSMVLSYLFIFLFLYVTLAVLRGHPFWESLGWRKLNSPWPKFFFGGIALSIVVAAVNSRTKVPDNTPIEELFKHRETAMLFVAMAVLIAPLVEETLFRGYLYPLLARTMGVGWGIVITGTLFGLMHGAQLGWSFGLVAVLIFVGIVFTMVRARTGSVLASYLMHLGYNSLIAIAMVVTSHGFTSIPSPK